VLLRIHSMSGSLPPPSVMPEPIDVDDDDVAWALQTAAVQWKRGAHPDAVEWLRRAAESAVDVGHHDRAVMINRAAAELARREGAASPGGSQWSEEEVPTLDVGSAGPDPRDVQDSDDGAEVIDVHQFHQPTTAERLAQQALDREELDRVRHGGKARASSRPPAPPPRSPFAAFRQRAAARVSGAPPRLPSTAPAPEVVVESPAPMTTINEVEGYEAEVPDLEYRQSYLPEELAAMLAGQSPAARASMPDITIEGAPPAARPVAHSRRVEPTPPPERPLRAPVSPAPPPVSPAPRARRAEPAPASAAARHVNVAPAASSSEEASSPVSVGGVRLGQVPGLEDLPDEAQATFAHRAQLSTLGVGEEVGAFAVALIVRGWVDIMPMIADCACARAKAGEVVFTEGTLDERIPLRVVAGETPTLVAVWDAAALQAATADCPWVDEELRTVADRFQALAGAAMGELGDRFDDAMRFQVTERCQQRSLLPHEVLVAQGAPVDGLYIIGAGRIELVQGEADAAKVLDELGPGDLVFASAVLAGDAAPHTARAGARGALVLHAPRHDANELMMVVPPLLELLSG
jgi:hypothetical protein